MRKVLCFIFILLFSSITFSQNIQAEAEKETKELDEQDITQMSQVKLKVKTKVSLAKAIKLMEKYIAKEKIDTSKYYLWRANLIQYGSQDNKRPAWNFWWLSENGSVGDHIEILVFMDKKTQRIPSM